MDEPPEPTPPPQTPSLTPQAEAAKRARQAREAAALRQNLHRRKEQQRREPEGDERCR